MTRRPAPLLPASPRRTAPATATAARIRARSDPAGPGTVLRLSADTDGGPAAESSGAKGPVNDELLRRAQQILAEAGYEPGNGLTATVDGPDILVSWHPDSLIRPLITAHSADPEVHRAAEIPGLRAAIETALMTVFQEAGYTPLPHPGGTLRLSPLTETAARTAPASSRRTPNAPH
ncbi:MULTISPECIES: hypothetical protein [unclassified Streptomyces]|uniref:hypothetical protein n=1 Tax=unclassified Streptomyces TaxID=2593676 RepID=UPI0036F7C9ED